MMTVDDEEFTQGIYGDQSGVVFYGQPANGSWIDSLAVSDSLIAAVFEAIWERALKDPQSARAPKLIADWNCGEGWTGTHRIVEISRQDAEELEAALGSLAAGDPAAQSPVTLPEKFLRCARAIRDFLQAHVDHGLSVYVEDDRAGEKGQRYPEKPRRQSGIGL